jgi:hypothetical protein
MELCFVETVPSVVHADQCLGQRTQPCLGLPQLSICLGEQAEVQWLSHHCSRGAVGSEALTEQGKARFTLPLHGHSPPPYEGPQCLIERKLVFTR